MMSLAVLVLETAGETSLPDLTRNLGIDRTEQTVQIYHYIAVVHICIHEYDATGVLVLV